MKNCSLIRLSVIGIISLSCNLLIAAEKDWPKTIQTDDTHIVIYQPQLEKLKDNKLTARSVISVTIGKAAEPVFGVLCFKSQVETDLDNRTATLTDISVNKILYPDTQEEQKDKVDAILKSEVPKWTLQMSLDEMITSLELVEKEKKAGDELKNEPPKIIFSEVPAVLVTFEGEPKLMKVEDTNLMKVVNTPFFVVLDMSDKTYYLKAGDFWMKAKNIEGSWQPTTTIPAVAAVLAEKKNASTATGKITVPEANGTDSLLQIITATEPTELIVTDGEPEFQVITGTNLLYVSNTDSDVFMDINTQQLYVLLSGRWFTAPKKEGPWSFVYPNKLPEDFAKIPPGSEKGLVRAHVAGTEEAKEAVADTYIPQTAIVKRSDANLTVTYDGEPQFKQIEGTPMKYAINTPYSVIYVNNMYYCCHNAVWFSADNPLGPWTICTEIPQVIYTMPPSCPIYPVKYVYIYDSTPEVVYVGYTSGYLNCYPYYGCVVYGTGYYYQPWYGTFCYPGPLTWGFGFYYNDITGCWGFGISRGHGWFRRGIITGGWWGHCVFGFDDFDIRHNIGTRHFDNFRRFGHDRFAGINNIFVFHRNTRPFGIPQTAFRIENRRNNLFSDPEGHIYRNTINGWEHHNLGGWSRIESQNRPQAIETPPRENRPQVIEVPAVRERRIPEQRPAQGWSSSVFEQHRQELNQEFMARDRAVERMNRFQEFQNIGSNRFGGEIRGGGEMRGGGEIRGGDGIRDGGGMRGGGGGGRGR